MRSLLALFTALALAVTAAACSSGSSDGARWMSEYHPSTAAHPELVAGRISRRRSPTSKLRRGKRRRASATIPGERSIPIASAPPSAR